MQSPAPSSGQAAIPSGANPMGSVIIVEGASLSKRNGGGLRSRVMLSCLQDLGDVDVISVVTKKRHVARTPKIEGVRSHEIIVVPGHKWSDMRRMISALLAGKSRLSPTPLKSRDVEARIADIIKTSPGTRLIALRYFKTWNLASLSGSSILNDCAVWLDLDDREDKLVAGKLARSRFGFVRKLGPRASKLKKLEIADAARATQLCSLASQSDVADLAPGANVIELANVVPTVQHLTGKPSEGQDLLFVGAYSWPPNVNAIEWFIDNCWDQIRDENPEAHLNVIGAGRQSVRNRLAKKYSDRAGIEWHFDVPDLAPFYASTRAVVSPVQIGSGSKIKVIEAAAFGRPTIVTPHSARGLAPDITSALAIAETGKAFAAACTDYLRNPAKADLDGAALRAAQIKHHSLEAFKAKAFAALQDAAPFLNFPETVKSRFDPTSQQTNEVHQ